MRLVSFDTETALIRPGVTAPEMACLTWQCWSERNPIIDPSRIVHASGAETVFENWLLDPERHFTGANTAFDMGVICANFPRLTDLVWDAYCADRVTDVQIREKLLDIAAGKFQGYHTPSGGWLKPRYALSEVAGKYGRRLDKPASIVSPATGKQIDDPLHCRLRFQELSPYPVEEWDERALSRGFHGPPPTVYAKEDAEATLLCHLAQEQHAAKYLKLQCEYARRAWAMFLMSAWGVRTDPARVAALAARAEEERGRVQEFLMEHGLVRKDGTRDMKKARALMVSICREESLPVPLTKTGLDPEKTAGMTTEAIEEGYASLGEDACDGTEDPLLMAFADFGRWGSVISKDVTALAKGTVYPIHTRIDIAATGRGTSSKPNMQNWGRDVGPRECIVPRPGMIFVQADYEALELRTLAQVCVKLFGWSRLADALNAGMDPHLALAAKILGITYEEAKRRKKDDDVDNARQTAKVANFGFPGGLGAEKLVLWARKTYGVIMTIERAKQLKEEWLAQWPEMAMFFEYINRLTSANPNGLANIEVPISGWRRGGAPYCAACNTMFQSLGAAAAGRGCWYLAKACYRDRDSILFGSRNVIHVHDENIGEILDDANAHAKALEWERLMLKGANELLPDVPATAPPMLMRFWSKKAFALKSPEGLLIPWNGEWVCAGNEKKRQKGCGKIFMGPAPSDLHCGAHTTLWAA